VARPNAEFADGLARLVAALFGAVLGLSLMKWGNPVILDQMIPPPDSAESFISESWPLQWGLSAVGLVAISALPLFKGFRWPRPKWLLPVLWFWLVWQTAAASQTVDRRLTSLTLPHLIACGACFHIGLLLGQRGWPRVFWLGLMVGLSVALVKGANQHLFEYRRDYQVFAERERTGWKEVPAAEIDQLKRQGLLIDTPNGVAANPVILDKLRRGRISGTLVYPNALAGAILLLFPAAMAWVLTGTRRLRPITRWAAIVLSLFLGFGCLYWTGSKAGWIVALGLLVVTALTEARLPTRLKLALAIGVGVVGMCGMAWRFSDYFRQKAPSLRARTDYWRAAVANTTSNPVFGSGPGTFSRVYARLKGPEAEMARLVHNDYLEQATDSGVPGFVGYGVFVVGVLVACWGHRGREPVEAATLLGVTGWFAHGFVEFGLYIPALAWNAFALAGLLIGSKAVRNGSTGADPPTKERGQI
jgi:O-antigen ligase